VTYDLTPIIRGVAHALIALTWVGMFAYIAGVHCATPIWEWFL